MIPSEGDERMSERGGRGKGEEDNRRGVMGRGECIIIMTGRSDEEGSGRLVVGGGGNDRGR